jgi:excisionase family DNA binding protein
MSGTGISEGLELITVQELQKILRLGRNNTYDILRAGLIPSIKIGRQIRIRKADVLEYLSQK